MSNPALLLDPPKNAHIALLYENKDELDRAIAAYINKGLHCGQYCVYATVHYRDEGHLETFSTMIDNYKEHVEKGDLQIVDLAPFYIASLVGGMKAFEDAKKLFIENVKNRPNKHVRFVGDGTGFLFKNKHFDACTMIEEWWQDKPFEGSYICPFSKQFLNTYPHEIHLERAVISTHEFVVNASEITSNSNHSDQPQSISAGMLGINTDDCHLNIKGRRNQLN